MDIQAFQDKRQELIGLTEALARVEGIEASTMTRPVADVVGEVPGAETVPVAREVAELARKLREDQFRIALVAPFQSGKSTTFDALLGGEEVSPRGDNTSTSATIVHGRHTTDPALVGRSEVTWKNDAELLLMLPEKLLVPHLADLAPERFAAEGAALDDLRLNDPRDLDLLRRATEREWARYREKPRGYGSDNLDLLRAAYVMVHHYGNAHLRALQARQGLLRTEEEVEPLVRFPRGWARRFDPSKPEPEPFDDAETTFLFVKKVTCYVDSPALAALGCSVVDCPGLFANRYDTSVTLEELGNCDVAWVLLGEKAVADTERKQIKAVAKAKPGAMVFSLNMRPEKPKRIYEEKIRPADVARLNQTLPTPITAEDCLLYQARLALTAVQAGRLRAGTLPEPTQAQIMRRGEEIADEDEPFESPLAVLEALAQDDLEALGVLEDEEVSSLSFTDPQGVAIARRESGLDTVVETLQRNVVVNRGRIILKTNGSDRLRRAVDALRTDTERHAQDLREGLAAAEARVAEKQKRLDAYVRVCDEQFAALANMAGLAADLEEEFLARVAGPTRKETLEEALADVTILVGKRREALQAWLDTAFRRILDQNLRQWAFDMRDGKSEAFKGFRKQLATIQRKVEVALKGESPLPGDGSGRVPGAPDIRLDIAIGPDWGKIIGIVADIVAMLPLPGGKLVKLVKGARFVAAVALKIFGKTLPTQEEKLAQAMRDDLPEALGKACRDYAKTLSAAWAEALFRNAQEAIRAGVEARRRDLEADLAQVREELGCDQAAREQTLARLEATLAQVRPIDERLAAFEAELARLLA